MSESNESNERPNHPTHTNLEDAARGPSNEPASDPENELESDGAADNPQGAQPNDAASARRPRRRQRHRRPPQQGDERSTPALNFLTEVLGQMGMDCEVSLVPAKEGEDTDIALEISGHDAARIIGKKGQVLAALQFLVNRVVNRPDLDRRYVTVDAEGYRHRRDTSLATMAQRLGQQAVTDGKIITFEPMNPRDRRVVHLALAKFEGVITKSEGEGADRRVQIIPVRR